MKYSAGMMSVPFLFLETRKTAQQQIAGKSFEQIKQMVLEDNLYQMKSLYRAERYFNVIRRRLESLPTPLVEVLSNGDLAQAKQILIIAIMRTDLLFAEFLYEVYRTELILGSPELEDMKINLFFDEKARQSDVIRQWKDTTVYHLKQYYVRILFEAGLLSGIKPPRRILKAYFNEGIVQTMLKEDMKSCLESLTGGHYA